MTIGERIKERRNALKLSQEELATKLGYKSRSSINKIELSRNLPITKVEDMAKALNCTPAYLMGWADLQGNPIKTSEFDKYLGEVSKGEHPATAEIIQIIQQLDGYLIDKLLDKAHQLLDAQKDINS